MSSQDTLFDVLGHDDSPKRKKWGGAQSKAARDKCRALLPCPCHRCGRVISPEDPESSWQAGHVVDRAETEALGLPEAETLPECTRCNLKAGGQRGAAMTNARHQTNTIPSYRESEPQWW